jgi:hypothetical protein
VFLEGNPYGTTYLEGNDWIAPFIGKSDPFVKEEVRLWFKSDIASGADPRPPWEQDFLLRAPIKGAK